MKKSCSNYLSILDRTAIALSSEGMVTVVDDRIKVKSSTTLHGVSVTLSTLDKSSAVLRVREETIPSFAVHSAVRAPH